MPPTTKNLGPVIVYVPPAVKDELDRTAGEEGDGSASAVARRVLVKWMRERVATR